MQWFDFISGVFFCMDFFRFSDPLCIANDGYGYIYFPSKCVQNIPSIFVGVSIWYIHTLVCTCLNDGLSPALLGHSNENITRDSKDIGWCSNLVSIRKKSSEPMFKNPLQFISESFYTLEK